MKIKRKKEKSEARHLKQTKAWKGKGLKKETKKSKYSKERTDENVS